MQVTLVTGNRQKLAEWQRLVPTEVQLTAASVELQELQTLDLEALIADKAQRAYEVIGGPVIVEDIAAGLENLQGLPGPFIKFFEQQLGEDALYQLAKEPGERATVHCAVAYFNGSELTTVDVTVHGTVVAARGEYGFGFDKVFQLDGQTKTYGEMTPAEKDAVSHRALAVRELFAKLSN